jgi:Leucine-rich repeat (LRR) protein
MYSLLCWGISMAFKLGHGLGLALAIAAAGAGCDSKPKGAAVPSSTGVEKPATKPTTTASASTPKGAVPPTAQAKIAAESPGDRVTRLGGVIEREGSTVTRIDFFGTQVSDSDLEVLRSFPDLQSLGLSGTKITDAGLEHLVGLKKLHTLSLGFTDVTDAGLISLAKLPALQHVDLLRTKVTTASLAELQKALPQLNVSK